MIHNHEVAGSIPAPATTGESIRRIQETGVYANLLFFFGLTIGAIMKKIINPWRNHPEYNCFGCCPDNPIGLHLEFYEDGDYIVSTWHPEKNYQGWVNTMHGGILSTLIDEVCGWVVTRKLQTSGYTVQLNVKFRKAVSTTEPELTIRAKVTKQVRNLAYISAEITNSKGELCNEGEAIYFLMNQEKANEMGFLHCDVEE